MNWKINGDAPITNISVLFRAKGTVEAVVVLLLPADTIQRSSFLQREQNRAKELVL